MKSHSLPASLFVLAILSISLATAQTYTITDLGVLGGERSSASAINDSGQIVGSSYINFRTSVEHAFLWTSSTGLQDLGTLGGDNSLALGINNSGQIVGCADLSHNNELPEHAFLWTQAGGMQDLGSLGGSSCALAINNAGQVVGYSTVNTNVDQHAFLWTATTGMQDLGVPVSSATVAASINDSGQVAGTYYTSTGGNHAYLWTQSAGFKDLGNLGVPNAFGAAINNSGQMVGSSEIPPGRNDTYAGFLWTAKSHMKQLPSPYPGNDATASAINATGEIVGFALNAKIEQRATLWLTPSQVFDLNDLATNSTLLSLNFANGVNRQGLIVGVGTDPFNPSVSHAYLATPAEK